MALTIKQKRFVEAYFGTPNGKKAAIAAGYSERTAEKAASRLLRHPEVAAVLDRMRRGESDAPAKPKTPLEYLLGVLNDPNVALATRIRAAIAAAPYVHAKPTVASLKEAEIAARKAAGGGRFNVRTGPPLALVRPSSSAPV